MSDNEKDERTDEEKWEDLQAEIKNKKGSKQKKAEKLIATRDKIERDYEEDQMKVTFATSPETSRTLLVRKPNPKEMKKIMIFSAQATRFEGSSEADALEKMADIYEELAEMASRLSVDDQLDKEFWREHVSFPTLQDFITSLIVEVQKPSVTKDEYESFR